MITVFSAAHARRSVQLHHARMLNCSRRLAAPPAVCPPFALARAAAAARLLPARQLSGSCALRLAKRERDTKPAASASKGGKPASASAAAVAFVEEDDAGDIEAEVAAGSAKDLKGQMSRPVDYVKRELSKLRGAQASPNMLDHVVVEAYGERQTLPAVAQIALKTANLIVVNPFDAALADAIGDAIRDADLNLNPQVEGSLVRVPIPKSSKETKEATVKLISKIAESGKNRVRRVRQAAMEKLKKTEGVSTDDTFRDIKDVNALASTATDQIAALAEKKKLEVESQ